jgi:hypothetical protein
MSVRESIPRQDRQTITTKTHCSDLPNLFSFRHYKRFNTLKIAVIRIRSIYTSCFDNIINKVFICVKPQFKVHIFS